jgi:hypothetical protein
MKRAAPPPLWIPGLLLGLILSCHAEPAVPLFAPHEPAPGPALEAVQLDDSVLIAAKEIWVDVQMWEHRPEWSRVPAG